MSAPIVPFERLPSWAPGWEKIAIRGRQALTGVVVHRIEVSQEDPRFGDNPSEVARFFRDHPVGVGATGGAMPYPILIDAKGGVTQTLPLDRIAPHAAVHNPTTVGVGVIGDFRHRSPGPAQRQSLVAVCAALLAELGLGAEAVHGHDELRGGSRDPNKECPGAGLALPELRAEVAAALAAGPEPLPFVWGG